jgi:beta-galactosidase
MHRTVPSLTALLLLLCVQAVTAQEVAIAKLLTFATGDEARIEVTLNSTQEVANAELSGLITRYPSGPTLWQGALGSGSIDLHAGTPATLSSTAAHLKAELWEPSSPALYQLKVTARKAGQPLAEKSVRFGFRSFESRNSQFYLNGRPMFLRGLAINPPGRGIPPEVGESRAFAEAYVRCLKNHNVNIIRMTHDSQVWFEVCDELGMMVYQGVYGSPPANEERKAQAPTDFDKSLAAYKQVFETYAAHPSILIYILSNELPVSGTRGQRFHDFLTRAHAALKPWDPTRLYIGNAGYGEGREGDICDVHRYWGWYYNSFLTYYNLRDKLVATPLYGDIAKNQPLTFTECVGSFTGSSGEFNVVRSKQLAPQLGWIGGSPTPREDALRYQAFMVKQATESFRRLRPLNPRLSGIMPFTILFYNWSGITSFNEMKAKPALEQMGLSYQPVLLSWELWTPQVYAGSKLHVRPHVINDADNGAALTEAKLVYRIQSRQGTVCCEGTNALPEIPYYGTWSQPLELDLPAELPTGDYLLSGNIVAHSRTLSTNSVELFVAGKDWKHPAAVVASVYLYDPPGKTAAALQKAGIDFKRLTSLTAWPPAMSTLVLGEGVWDQTLTSQKEQLQRFVRQGGRLLCLRQWGPGLSSAAPADAFDWLPAKIVRFEDSPNDPQYPPRTRPFAEQMNVNLERPGHPVFQGLDRHQFSLWSDYTSWNQTQPGFPRVYPVTAGFKLAEPEALGHTAILADYDRGLEGIALCELFDGAGSVILSGLDLVNRTGLDPVADRLLGNLVTYTASKPGHEVHPLIEHPIRWGNYATECGTVCGSLNGLPVNAEWVAPPTQASAKALPPNTGSWNMEPGEQFVPHGRNPLGAFGYTTGSSFKDHDPDSATGSGIFWARIPPGKHEAVTRVKNPFASAGELSIAVNGKTATGPTAIASSQTLELHSPLPPGTTEVTMRFTGTKTLVLLETRFE